MTDAEREFAKEWESHMETWGPHCGAPKSVYEGHLRALLKAYRMALLAKREAA